MSFSNVRASFLRGIFTYRDERVAPVRITALWEALEMMVGVYDNCSALTLNDIP